MMGKIEIRTNDDKKFEIEKEDYAGFFTRPMEWKKVQEKFKRLTSGIITDAQQQKVISTVMDFENKKVTDLTEVFENVEIDS
jgi:2-methylcitrate dehydratase